MATDKTPQGPSKLEQIRALGGGMPGIARRFASVPQKPPPSPKRVQKLKALVRKTGRGR